MKFLTGWTSDNVAARKYFILWKELNFHRTVELLRGSRLGAVPDSHETSRCGLSDRHSTDISHMPAAVRLPHHDDGTGQVPAR
jgi:hypothetical protein